MTAAELKASILDRAVRGLLVPQDPSEGNAADLFSRDGRARSPSAPQPIADPPYDLPQGWVWKRGKDIGTMERGAGIKRNETVAEGLPCLRYGEIYTSYTHYLDKAKSFVPAALFKACKHIKKNDLVFTLTGENEVDIAKTLAYLGDEEIAAGGDLAIWSNHNCFAPYLAYMMAAPSIIKQKAQSATGNFIVHTSTKKIGEIMIPLPPLAEQKRIVAKIEELMPLVEEYGKAETELAALNDNFPTALRKSILQHAVEGKLTAEWRRARFEKFEGFEKFEKLETAADLLAKIAAEKKSLLAAGKIKKSKPLPPITDDEKPFPIPETWAWVRLGEIGTTITGSTPSTKDKSLYGNDIPFIKPAAIFEDHIDYSGDGLSRKGGESARLIAPDSILMVCIGTIGKAYFTDRVVSCNQQINAITPFCVDTKYLLLAMQSPVFQDSAWNESSSTTISILNKSTWENLPIPLPPLAEQKAIVARVEELLKLVEEMKE